MAEKKLTSDQQTRKDLYLVAYILMIIGTVCSGWLLITLAWMIPMTIFTKRAMDEVGTKEERSHLVLGICEILFCGVVAGILATVASALFESKNTK